MKKEDEIMFDDDLSRRISDFRMDSAQASYRKLLGEQAKKVSDEIFAAELNDIPKEDKSNWFWE